MPSDIMKIIIFTDLDGTLLDHNDYSFEDARSSLTRIKGKDIPLIITTSKTRKEVESLRNILGINDPFIVENGGGIFFPEGYRGFNVKNSLARHPYAVLELGKPYDKIKRFLKRAGKQFAIRGFDDLTIQEIMEFTGLPVDDATMAKEREFTEPFVLQRESDLDVFSDLAMREGMKVVRGGRFFHLISVHQDKGKAVKITKDIFRENYGEEVITIGLGDRENDLPMLENVDIPVLMPYCNGGYEELNLQNLIKSKYPGSKGWNESVKEILNDLERDDF